MSTGDQYEVWGLGVLCACGVSPFGRLHFLCFVATRGWCPAAGPSASARVQHLPGFSVL